MVKTSTIRRSVWDLLGVVFVLTALIGVYLPTVAPAWANHDDGGSFNGEDGVLDAEDDLIPLEDACGGSDDRPINGAPYKLNVIDSASPPVIEFGNVTGKADICNIWLGTETIGTDIYLYLAWSRDTTNGSTVFAFEFNHADPPCDSPVDISTCNPFSARAAGDFLLIYDFQGNVVDLGRRNYDGSVFGPVIDLPETQWEAALNGDTSFGEAVINLTEAGILPAADDTEACTTLANIIPMTVTGNSDQAEIMDVVLDIDDVALSNCGEMVITKETVPSGLSGPFTATLDGGPKSLSTSAELAGDGSSWTYGDDEAEELFAGSYTVGETDIPSGWDSDYTVACTDEDGAPTGSDGQNVQVTANETTTCVITNTAILPQITLAKTVTDSWGGGATQGDFTPTLNGDAKAWDTPYEVSPGTYTASETGALLDSGAYALDSIACVDTGTTDTVAHPVELGLGDDVTCTLTNVDQPATITLLKTVTNDDGGTASKTDFTPRVDGNDTTWEIPVDVAAGPHTVSEVSQLLTDGDYLAGSWGGDCGADGSIDVVNGQSYTCSIVNDDVPATLTLVKLLDNGDGGDATAGDFTPLIDGSTTVQEQTVVWEVPLTLDAGAYTASESGQLLDDGAYTGSDWTGDCDADGSVTLELGDDATCYLTNDDVAPTLIVDKVVINDDGGTLTEDDFGLTITPEGGSAQPVTDEAQNTVQANKVYTVAEQSQAGYTPLGIECTDGSSSDGTSVDVTLGPGDVVTCTITNDDQPATVTLVKTVENDDGGTATQADFTPYINGGQVTWDDPIVIPAGSHTASETGDLLDTGAYLAGSWGGDCLADGSFTAVNGGSYTCTITNDDVPATVVLRKKVNNDHGGTADRGDFTPALDGTTTTWGTVLEIDAGTHTASESGSLLDTGAYVAGGWRGDCETDGTFTAVNGGSYDCIITNTDVAPTLTLIKVVVNDDGGDATAADFQAAINGNDVPWGVAQTLTAGVEYTASESGPDGYAASAWTGDCDGSDTITLSPGEDATCVITNDDIAPTLTVVKDVINDDGGNAEVGDFALFIDDAQVTSGDTQTMAANTAYTVSETPVDGYAQTSLVCTDDATEATVANPVILDEGQDVTCVITNDDLAPGLTVFKEVINDDGGDAVIGDFPLFIDDTQVTSGDANEVDANTTYTISETQLDGYELVGIACTNGDSTDSDTIQVTLDEGEAVGCTITNDDIAPTVTVVKSVVGGTAAPDDFGLTLDGDLVASGSTTEVTANEAHLVSEAGLAGYVQTGLACTDDATDATVAHPLVLDEGQAVTCVLTNAISGISLVKTALIEPDADGFKSVVYEPEDGDDETITYEYRIVNTGEVTLTDITLVDDVLGEVTLPKTTLAPAESMTATAVHVVTDADADAGEVVNIGTVTGLTPDDQVVTDDDDEQVFVIEVLPVVLNPDISIVKTALIDADDDGLKTVTYDADDAAGNMVEYEYLITNTGDVTLTDITLVDDVLGDIVLPKTTLEPGESMTATATHLVTGADADEGQIVNVAEATGSTDGGTVSATDDETVYVVEVLQLALTGIDADIAGMLAAGLLALGGVLLLLGRKRPEDL
jgi:hypothetical protein